MKPAFPKYRKTLSLFCRLVDNFGDIGVCWRLSRDLALHHGWHVRLWVDDFLALQRIVAGISPRVEVQQVAGVEFRPWRAPFDVVTEDAVVIEAFACELPAEVLTAMAARSIPPVWINLEYLSAEDWVADLHGLPSPHPRLPLRKHFFFPGFDEGTGGLLREPGLFTRREAFRQDELACRTVLAERSGRDIPPDARVISLFAYEQPALPELLRLWSQERDPLWLLVPEGRVVPDVAAFFGLKELALGACHQAGSLKVCVIPFSDQDGYDRLLWACGLNFVRGEDSFVRAQWAGAPFVWHIYPQQEEAHRIKLEAFLQRFLAQADAGLAVPVRAFWLAWNGFGEVAEAWPAFAEILPEYGAHCRAWAASLGQQRDLATNLVEFVERCV